MGDYSNEDAVGFWNRPEAMAAAERAGPFKEGIERLTETFAKYRDQLEPGTIEGDKVLKAPEVVFTNSRTNKKKWPQAKAFAFLNLRTNELSFALDPDTKTSEMHRFRIDGSGHLLSVDGVVDDFSDSFGSSEKDVKLFSDATISIEDTLAGAHEADRRRKEQRRRTTKRWVGSLATLSIIGGGAALGVKEWYFDPRAEDKAARQAYDAEKHVLGAEPVPVQSQEIDEISSGEFDDIPSFKDGDNFRSPRTIEVEGNDCFTWRITTGENDAVRIGLEEDDPLSGSTVGLLVDEDRKHVTICLAGPDSPDANTNDPKKSELAIQVLSADQQ